MSSSFSIQYRDPAPPVSDYVRSYYLLTGSGARTIRDTFFANGHCELVFNLGLQFHAADATHSAKFIGQILAPLPSQLTGSGLSFGVVLTPRGAAMMLSGRVHRLNDRMVPLSDLLPAHLLARTTNRLEQGDLAAAIRVLEAHFLLLRKTERYSPSATGQLEAAMRRMDELSWTKGTGRAIADELGVSPRYLQRLFRDRLGLRMGQYARIRRFNRFLGGVSSREEENLTALAYAHEFYDQSHLIREVRRFTRLTPGELLRRDRPLATVYD